MQVWSTGFDPRTVRRVRFVLIITFPPGSGRGQETIYYACVTNPEHHREQPWYARHPQHITVREDHLLPVVGRFFGERILGPQRAVYLERRRPQSEDDGAAAQRAALRKQLDQLGRAQTNLIKQLEAYEPTGDDDLDTEWTAALQRRFAQITTQRRAATASLAALDKQDHDQAGGNTALLDLLPQGAVDVTLLSEEEQRALYDAFHLQVRYDRTKHHVTLRVTIYAETVDALTDKIHALDKRSHVVSAPGGIQPKTAPRTGSC